MCGTDVECNMWMMVHTYWYTHTDKQSWVHPLHALVHAEHNVWMRFRSCKHEIINGLKHALGETDSRTANPLYLGVNSVEHNEIYSWGKNGSSCGIVHENKPLWNVAITTSVVSDNLNYILEVMGTSDFISQVILTNWHSHEHRLKCAIS